MPISGLERVSALALGTISGAHLFANIFGETLIRAQFNNVALVVAALVAATELIRAPGRLMGAWPIILVAAIFAVSFIHPPLFATTANKPWDVLLLAIAPALLGFLCFTRIEQLPWFAAPLVAGAFATAILSVLAPDQALEEVGRIAGESLNPIHVSRICGMAAVILVFYPFQQRAAAWIARAGAAALVVAALATGSRQTLIGLLVAVAVVLVAVRKSGRTTALFLALLIPVSVFVAQYTSFERVVSTVDTGRGALWQDSLERIAENPFGVGWGNYVAYYKGPLWIIPVDMNLYSHNMILETAVEAGFIAAIALLVLVGWTILKSVALAKIDDRMPAFLGLLVFTAAVAMSSFAITGQRALFILMGAALALSGRYLPSSRTPIPVSHQQASPTTSRTSYRKER